MSTVSELIDKGVKKMRLPDWNDEAFLIPREVGPWADVHDINDTVIPVLIAECDVDDRWEAISE